jgi:hypothetical protein
MSNRRVPSGYGFAVWGVSGRLTIPRYVETSVLQNVAQSFELTKETSVLQNVAQSFEISKETNILQNVAQSFEISKETIHLTKCSTDLGN